MGLAIQSQAIEGRPDPVSRPEPPAMLRQQPKTAVRLSTHGQTLVVAGMQACMSGWHLVQQQVCLSVSLSLLAGPRILQHLFVA